MYETYGRNSSPPSHENNEGFLFLLNRQARHPLTITDQGEQTRGDQSGQERKSQSTNGNAFPHVSPNAFSARSQSAHIDGNPISSANLGGQNLRWSLSGVSTAFKAVRQRVTASKADDLSSPFPPPPPPRLQSTSIHSLASWPAWNSFREGFVRENCCQQTFVGPWGCWDVVDCIVGESR